MANSKSCMMLSVMMLFCNSYFRVLHIEIDECIAIYTAHCCIHLYGLTYIFKCILASYSVKCYHFSYLISHQQEVLLLFNTYPKPVRKHSLGSEPCRHYMISAFQLRITWQLRQFPILVIILEANFKPINSSPQNEARNVNILSKHWCCTVTAAYSHSSTPWLDEHGRL